MTCHLFVPPQQIVKAVDVFEIAISAGRLVAHERCTVMLILYGYKASRQLCPEQWHLKACALSYTKPNHLQFAEWEIVEEIDLTTGVLPIDAFQEAVDGCSPGAKIIYHRGQILAGSRLARAALKAFDLGRVELVQRRYGGPATGKFEFIAIKKGG